MADGSGSDQNGPVLLCTDGSEASVDALRRGLDLLDRSAPMIVVTVVPRPDDTEVMGTGIAGGVVSPEEFDRKVAEVRDRAAQVVEATRAELGLPADTLVVEGDAGPVLCDLAEERSARAIVMGTRGRGGIRRAVLGSVSDHVVRKAPCTVVVSRDGLDD